MEEIKNNGQVEQEEQHHCVGLPCPYFQQLQAQQMVPLFWKIMAGFHALVVVILTVTQILIASSLNTNITAERLTREAALQAAGDNRTILLTAINGARDDIHSHMRMTMENRTVQSEILGLLLRRANDKKP
jgi:hypothetical protein